MAEPTRGDLARIYAHMDTEEIQRRLASGQLQPDVTITIPGLGFVLAKRFPVLGFVLGVPLAATPVWLPLSLWKSGAFTWQTGDFAALGPLLAYAVAILGSAIGMGIGAMLLRGALHKGSWPSAMAELEEQQQDAMKHLRKLD